LSQPKEIPQEPSSITKTDTEVLRIPIKLNSNPIPLSLENQNLLNGNDNGLILKMAGLFQGDNANEFRYKYLKMKERYKTLLRITGMITTIAGAVATLISVFL